MMHIAISPDATFVQWEQAQAAQQRALIEAARAGDIPRLHAVSLVSDWARNEGNADVLVDSEGHWILLNPAAAQAEVVLSDGKSKDFDPGQRRDEHGRWVREGFHFASDDERRARVIPPAWTHVQINDDPTADLQVWGVDAKGRSQYRYSAAHTERQAKAKFQTTRKLNGDIQRIDDALARAAVVGDDAALGALLIARTGFRPGSEDNTGADEQAYGVSTLMAKHVKVKGDSVHFDFTGKSGHRQVHKINDPQLARLLGRKLEGKKPGEQVFDSSNVQMRDRLKREAPEYKLKDLRTRIGTVIAIQTVNSLPVPKTQAEFKKARNQVGDAVSGVLGNTRAVALASYVDPTAFAKWQVALIQKGGE
jgi:DNA topoisomerase-1